VTDETDPGEIGSIETPTGRTLHVYARPGDERPFMVGVSGDRRRPFTVALSPVELEALLTLLDVAGRRT
jgi:hypothetical protein